MQLSKRLAEFILNFDYRNIPSEIIDQSKRCFLDFFGVSIAGSKQDLSNILLDFVDEIGGNEQATILGKGVKTNILNAAFINGSMSHALEYDDTHPETLIHVSSSLIPAILAVGEYMNLSGKELINSYIIGYEVTANVGLLMGKSHYAKGWHSTSTIGRLGAAAGVGSLLRLNENQMIDAFGIAATQSSGLKRVFGSMCKSFHPGKAAMDAIMSCKLAQKGFSAPHDIFEGENGFLKIFSDDIDLSKLKLGKKFRLLENAFKPYSSCLLTHPAIYGIHELRKQHKIIISDVNSICCEVSRASFDVANKRMPKTGLESKFSVSHCTSLALLEDELGEDTFTDEITHNPKLAELRRRVKVLQNERLKDSEAIVVIKTKSGKEYKKHVKVTKGNQKNPMTTPELENKFRNLTSSILSKEKGEELIEKIKKFEKLGNIRELVQLCY